MTIYILLHILSVGAQWKVARGKGKSKAYTANMRHAQAVD